MEDLDVFESQNSEILLPTASEIREIKQKLLSGDKSEILESVEKLKKFLNVEKSILQILNSDISEFLCDAVLPLDSVLVCSVYSCIEVMAGQVEFFIHNHSCFAIESLIRTLHFLMKDSGSPSSLFQCLHLLNVIMKGYNIHKVTPERKTTENLLHLLPALVKNLSPTVNNKYHVGALILTLMELDMPKWSREISETIFINFSSWFNLLSEILESKHPMKEKLVLLCCALCHTALKYLISTDTPIEEFDFELDVNLKNDLITNIREFLINVGAPYFEIISLADIEKDPSNLENFYQTVLFFCTDEMTVGKNRLIHGLSEMGFLQFTTRIISFADFGHGQKLRRLCILVLFYMILHLSEDMFHFPDIWPNGREDFRSEMQHGIAQLPTDATQWLDVLISPETSFSCKLALLLYLFFYSMTAKSQDMLQVIYPAIVSFIRTTNGIESSVLLLKIIWFVFVMSQLSISEDLSLESAVESTNEMVSLLETQGDLSLVYTHHPSLLYWVFSSNVSSNIQTQTVHLWLRNKTPDCKELDELMRKSSDVRFAILDILQNGWGQELDSAFSSLKTLLLDSKDDDDDDLPASIWFLLPQILAKFTADFTSVTNVDYVIELCSLRTPQNLDVARIIRIASLLPEALLKSDLISIVPSLCLAFQLMHLGLQMDDNRILFVFLRHDRFVQKIIEGLNTKVFDVSIYSIKIINLIWREGKNIHNSEKRKKFEMKKENILDILETDCEEVLAEGLNFLQEVLMSHFRSSTFELGEIDVGFVEILFQNIQDICIKNSVGISKHCWHCLKLLLTVETTEGESIQSEFIANPLLHDLILFHLPHLKDSRELKEFLTVWMDLYNNKINDPCFGRKITGKFYYETVQRIGRKLMEEYKRDDQILLEKLKKSGFVVGSENTESQNHFKGQEKKKRKSILD